MYLPIGPAGLRTCHAVYLDPDLQFFSGRQFVVVNRSANFGVFLDSAPDGWGMTLLQNRERDAAKDEKRPAKQLTDTDFLLGVFDRSRIGALRFKLDVDGPFSLPCADCLLLVLPLVAQDPRRVL